MVKDIPYDQYALQAVYLAIKSGMCIYSLANNIFLHLCMLHDSTLKILLTSQSKLFFRRNGNSQKWPEDTFQTEWLE